MNIRQVDLSRRRFLRGAGGVTVGLPLLDAALRTKAARAQAAREPAPIALVVTGNGVQQAGFGAEAERFWPTTPGPITRAGLSSGENANRATGQLADLADRMVLVRGVMVTGGTNGCDHQAGAIQHLTAARMTGSGRNALPLGESVDNFIAKAFNQPESLLLYAGTKSAFNTDGVSFRGPSQLRVGEGNPFTAYTKLMNLYRPQGSTQVDLVATRRNSVNDFVRAELRGLLSRSDLSRADRQRLDQHFSAIRDMEVRLTVTDPIARPAEGPFAAINGRHEQNGQPRHEVIRLQSDLMAFALAARLTPIVVLQASNITDDMVYTLDGRTIPRFHLVSHRNSNDTGLNDGTMPLAEGWHHQIDRIRLREFKYLADKMQSYMTPMGTLLDVGVAVWTNTLGTGSHIHHNLPWIFVGRARGSIRVGQYLNVSNNTGSDARGNLTGNRILNDLIAISGARRSDGGLVDNFGDASGTRGFIPGLRT